jgi:hypothetical protein
MTDATDTSVTLGHQLSLSSLASFRALSAHSANVGRIDTTDVARVAAELLTDARQVRGMHSDAIVVAPSESAEHELHVNLHACERAALAAQRRGVEALTARLRNDDDLLDDVSTQAFADLEASARSLLAAASLSDQLRSAVAIDGPPPPPPMQQIDLDLEPIDNVVVDLTGPSADLSYRTPERGPGASSTTLPPLPGGAEGWEQRRTEILARVERVRGNAVEDLVEPIEADTHMGSDDVDDATLSPIIAAALASATLLPTATPDVSTEPVSTDALRLVPALDEDTGVQTLEPNEPEPEPDGEAEDSVDSVESAAADLEPTPSFTDDAVVIDIVDAPSLGSEDSGLADVIELQTEATAHEWPVWQGPNRDWADEVPDVVVPADDHEPEPAPEDYPRLVSVAPESPAPVVTNTEVDDSDRAGQTKQPMFGFAPPAVPVEEPASDLLPVPTWDTSRRSQEEIAAEARQLINDHRKAEKAITGGEFSEKEVRRRQRRLRKHQRAVEKAENKVQRDRKRAELQHERSLASESTNTPAVAPTWFGQLAFALGVCLLVIMVVVGVWFLLADDPGLF